MNLVFYVMMFIMINLVLFLINPMSLGLLMIIFILNINFLMGIIYYSFWFSYIMYLIFIGGLLILFIYVISLASNELFKFKLNDLFLLLNFLIFIILMNNIMNLMNQFDFINSIDLLNKMIFVMNNSNNDSIYLNISKLYNNNNFILLLILMNYLFIMLIMIVKIVNINLGTLRLKF